MDVIPKVPATTRFGCGVTSQGFQINVVAFSPSSGRSVVIEVKSAREVEGNPATLWVIGSAIPAQDPPDKPWVFVLMPADPDAPPTYYVALQWEVHEIVDASAEQYRLTHPNLRRALWNCPTQGEPEGQWEEILRPLEDRWDKIVDQLNDEAP